jgi:Holliday junction resolvasome RuvABC endonuclease subunit
VLDNGKIIVVEHFICTGELGDRLVQLRNKINTLIDEHNIDEVVFEDIQLQDVNGNKETGIKTFKVLAEVFGVVYELLSERKIKNTAVLPINC